MYLHSELKKNPLIYFLIFSRSRNWWDSQIIKSFWLVVAILITCTLVWDFGEKKFQWRMSQISNVTFENIKAVNWILKLFMYEIKKKKLLQTVINIHQKTPQILEWFTPESAHDGNKENKLTLRSWKSMVKVAHWKILKML